VFDYSLHFFTMTSSHALLVGATLALLVPTFTLAHERQAFTIGGTDYLFVVGSLAEPIVVDDKTGVELRVMKADPKDPTNSSALGAEPVTGLESALKVELIAGDKKKVLDFTTIYGTPGAYKAIFFPTLKTTLTYRVHGTLNNTPIDLAFTCATEGVTAVEDTSRVEVSSGVVRTYKNGQYGCPMGKEELGFPEASASLYGLHEDIHREMTLDKKSLQAKIDGSPAGAAMAFALIGIVMSALALYRVKKQA
jgi:hypothetical protein